MKGVRHLCLELWADLFTAVRHSGYYTSRQCFAEKLGKQEKGKCRSHDRLRVLRHTIFKRLWLASWFHPIKIFAIDHFRLESEFVWHMTFTVYFMIFDWVSLSILSNDRRHSTTAYFFCCICDPTFQNKKARRLQYKTIRSPIFRNQT